MQAIVQHWHGRGEVRTPMLACQHPLLRCYLPLPAHGTARWRGACRSASQPFSQCVSVCAPACLAPCLPARPALPCCFLRPARLTLVSWCVVPARRRAPYEQRAAALHGAAGLRRDTRRVHARAAVGAWLRGGVRTHLAERGRLGRPCDCYCACRCCCSCCWRIGVCGWGGGAVIMQSSGSSSQRTCLCP